VNPHLKVLDEGLPDGFDFHFGVTPCFTQTLENRFGIPGEKVALLSVRGWDGFTPPNVELYMLFFFARNLIRHLRWDKFKKLVEDGGHAGDGICSMRLNKEIPYEVTDLITSSSICNTCQSVLDETATRNAGIRDFLMHLLLFTQGAAREQEKDRSFVVSRHSLVSQTKMAIRKLNAGLRVFSLEPSRAIAGCADHLFDFGVMNAAGQVSLVHVCRNIGFVAPSRLGLIETRLPGANIKRVVLYHSSSGKWPDIPSGVEVRQVGKKDWFQRLWGRERSSPEP